jgi:hypothetical protein
MVLSLLPVVAGMVYDYVRDDACTVIGAARWWRFRFRTPARLDAGPGTRCEVA